MRVRLKKLPAPGLDLSAVGAAAEDSVVGKTQTVFLHLAVLPSFLLLLVLLSEAAEAPLLRILQSSYLKQSQGTAVQAYVRLPEAWAL